MFPENSLQCDIPPKCDLNDRLNVTFSWHYIQRLHVTFIAASFSNVTSKNNLFCRVGDPLSEQAIANGFSAISYKLSGKKIVKKNKDFLQLIIY